MKFAVGLGALKARMARFSRAKRGAIAMLFALAVLPLLLLIGMAVDFRTLQTSRANLQNALDAAVLTAARVYHANANLADQQREDVATAAGEAMYRANLVDSAPALDTQTIEFTYNDETGVITATGHADSQTAFGGLVGYFGGGGGNGIEAVRIRVYGEAMGSDPRRLEVVLALDNTGSMFDIGPTGSRRFDLMRSAAKNFVGTMFDNQSQPNKLYIGVIPWTTTVNINMDRPEDDYVPDPYAAPEVPTDGTREVPPAPFQDFKLYLRFPYGGNITGSGQNAGHSTLLSNPPAMAPAWTTLPGVAYDGANPSHVAAFNALFAPVEWRGCIRSADGERSMNGNNVSIALTDAPPSPMRWPVDAVEPLLKTFTSGSNNGRLDCSASGPNDSNYNSYISGAVGATRPCRTTQSTSTNSTIAPCVSDAYEFAWLARADVPDYCSFKTLTVPRSGYSNPWMAGPNVNCPASMLGLSGSREQILRKLNMMYANSDGTHNDVGLMWGLRMLSPRAEWKSFFGHTGDNQPAAYNTDDTRKILIVLTDGANVAPGSWEGYYGCTTTNSRNSGAGRAADTPPLPRGAEGCWGSSNVQGNITQTKLNNLMLDACSAIRNTYHIELYMIGVDIGEGSTAANLLEQCAGDAQHAKIISAAEIDETFLSIANETLRLTR